MPRSGQSFSHTTWLLAAFLASACNSNSNESAPSISAGLTASAIQKSVATEPMGVCLKNSISIISLSGNVSFAASTQFAGDIVALNNSSVQLAESVHIDGEVYLDTSAQIHRTSDDQAQGGVSQVDVSQDQALLTDFINSLSTLTTTEDLNQISGDMTIQSAGSLNVITVHEGLALGAGQKLTLSGSADDIFILNVSGNMAMAGGSGIVLSGGLKPTHVVLNNVGAGANVQLGENAEISGTVIAYERGINFAGGGTVRGTLISGTGVTLAGSSGVWNPQGFCPVAPPLGCSDLVCSAASFVGN